ncbi:MAG: DMT family transporter [Burkholderiaceae bacterium]|jgi:drug/metabolite transporter (DMT)-like permease|nr:DMT family transporter [Burkholderiaceae bacterium]
MTPRREHLDSLAISLLLGCCLFWGFQQVLIKATLPLVPPMVQGCIRFIGATALLMLWCVWRRIPLWQPDGSLRAGLVAGLLFALEFVCIYTGMQHTTASRLTILLYTAPFWVALLLPLWLKHERLRPLQWVGLSLAFSGVAFALRDSLSSGGSWLGDALSLAAGAAWGLTTVVLRTTALSRVSAEKLLFYQVGVSAAVLPLVAGAMGESFTLDYSLLGWSSLVLQAALGAFVTFLIWMWMISHYPATRVSAFSFLSPLSALVFGALWLGEPITPDLMIAMAGVGLGIYLVNRRR